MSNNPISKKRIFKRSLAIKLTERGHKILKVEKNKYNPGYMVYIFKSSLQLHEDLCKITDR
ncbi:hypothetical protein ACIQW7_05240 [Peribacillus simplex]|uniref:hypothetical protein n=1 Tax=Peribacillus simplex TaxID=1478 RepID=UPI003817E443